MLIKSNANNPNPTFNGAVIGGSYNSGYSTINGGVSMRIEDGTFNNYVYGGAVNSRSKINDGINLIIAGGTFKKTGIYVLGSYGSVAGDIALTISGDTAQFADNYIISAGANSSSVSYSGGTSTVTLRDISSTTKNSLAGNSTIKVDGGQQKSALVMDNVDTTIAAKLSNFKTMKVTNGSDLTLTYGSNATLGGVSSVTVDGNSTLSLEHAAGQVWNEYTGSIDVKSGSTLNLSGATKANLTVASGATLSVKEGDLFAAGAGNTFSVNGVTMAANEGTWTLNKATTAKDVTISGTGAVALGSEVDNAAVVSLSGNIDATKGNLILKNTAIAADKTATLSGNITFEGAVQNSGTLSLANGSTINIDEESLMRNGRFIDGADINASDKNGFFADEEVCLSSGGAYSYDKTQLTLTLDGVEDSRLELVKDSEKNQLLIGGLTLANTYFVREGDVTYSHITEVAETIKRDVHEIAVGNDGVGDTHQLTLDKALSGDVTVVSASDHAKVSVAEGVELNASQTAVKGEANEVHVVGDGAVLMDDASKLSQLAGDAAMKVKQNTSFSSEAKMTGALEVSEGATLTVKESGSVSSFSTVKLDEGTTLKSEGASNGTINALSGDGTLSKTGTGTLSISGDASAFNGAVEVDAGTLEVGKSVTLSAEKGATVGTNGVLLNDGVIGGALAVSGTLKGSGTMATTTIEEAGQLIVGNSPGKQTYTGDLTVEGAVDFSVDDLLYGVPATAETSGWGKGTHSVIDMDGHSIFLNGAVTLTLGTVAAGQVDGEGIFELVLVQNIGNAEDYTVEKLTDLYSATAFRDMDGVVVSSSSPLLSQAHYEMKGNDLVLTNTPTTPEPATATLSLLALAAIASRRKRH